MMGAKGRDETTTRIPRGEEQDGNGTLRLACDINSHGEDARPSKGSFALEDRVIAMNMIIMIIAIFMSRANHGYTRLQREGAPSGRVVR